MHWFWRATSALMVVGIYGGVTITSLQQLHDQVEGSAETFLGMVGLPGDFCRGASVSIAWFIPITLLGFVTFGLLSKLWPKGQTADRETRCRKCGYILRGISEPRCSECGEKI